MKHRRTPLLSIESPFPDEHSMLRFLEPPGTSESSIWERLFNGSYGKPFIVDIKLRRFLQFDLDAVQSAMDLQRPDRLCLAYTRKMMAFLLFNQTPRRILLLGLGGGSLSKFCYRQLPRSTITTVEVNPDVVTLRDEFSVPPDDGRFRVICADGASYVKRLSGSKDVIVADACDNAGIAPQLDALEFYANARRGLAPGGVFVVNVCGTADSRVAHLTKIRQVFGKDFLTLPVRADGNLIVFAFRDGVPPVSSDDLVATARELKRSIGLDFPRYVQRLGIDRQRRRTRRSSRAH